MLGGVRYATRLSMALATGTALALVGSVATSVFLVLLGLGLASGPMLLAIARRLPQTLDGEASRRPWLAGLWLLLALSSAAQTGRMSAFISDPSIGYGSVLPDYFEQHTCLAAYLCAAEMNDQGEANIYHHSHYPALSRDAAPTTTVVGMQPFLEDPFQYPPPFLLLPKIGLALSNDFGVLRMGWYILSSLLFFATALTLARWLGGRHGLLAGLAIPIIWTAIPTMLGLQYGQFHLTVLCLAMLGMLAFERGRLSWGGALLASAIVAKIFPAVLVVVLIVRRRWVALGWTAAYIALISLTGLIVLGPDSFVAFVDYHLPRLSDGQAFAFHDAWPEMSALLAAANQSPLGLVQKLGEIGVTLPAASSHALDLVYSLAVLGAAVFAGARVVRRIGQARLWMALLLLASMRSGGAWADYLMTAGLWTLSFWTIELVATNRGRIALVTAGLLLFFLPGIVPLPELPAVTTMMVLSLIGYAAALCVGFGGVATAVRAEAGANDETVEALERVPARV